MDSENKHLYFSWRAAILNSDLSPTTRHVLLTLGCHMNELGEGCFPSTKRLSRETGLSERAVITHLQLSTVEGWIGRRIHGFAGQRYSAYEYVVNFPGQDPNDPSRYTDDAPTYESSERIRAHKIVAGAIGRGTLTRKPCEVCGDINSESHHPDYSKPLEVHWLCRAHHQSLERQLKKQAAEGGSASLFTEPAEPPSELAERDDKNLLKDVQHSTSVSTSESTSGAKSLRNLETSRQRKLSDLAMDSFVKKYGTKPTWRAADYCQLALLVRVRPGITPEEFGERWLNFMESGDAFHQKRKGSLRYFAANYDQFMEPIAGGGNGFKNKAEQITESNRKVFKAALARRGEVAGDIFGELSTPGGSDAS